MQTELQADGVFCGLESGGHAQECVTATGGGSYRNLLFGIPPPEPIHQVDGPGRHPIPTRFGLLGVRIGSGWGVRRSGWDENMCQR
ncbi:MAG: hypothetical protein HYX75_04090 [Acidobacteria bacterium]|nr:hypothetical protein [Acidobacteriota bacterium]